MDIKKIIESLALLVCCGLIWALTEYNYSLLSNIVHNSTVLSNWIKSLVFGIAGMVVIIYYPNRIIKAAFIALDAGVVFVSQHFTPELYQKYGSFLYPVYTAFILGGIGNIAFKLFTDLESQRKKELKENETIIKLSRELEHTKQLLKSNSIDTQELHNSIYEDTKQKLTSIYEDEINTLKDSIEKLQSDHDDTKKKLVVSNLKIEHTDITKQVTNLRKGRVPDDDPKLMELLTRLNDIHEILN